MRTLAPPNWGFTSASLGNTQWGIKFRGGEQARDRSSPVVGMLESCERFR